MSSFKNIIYAVSVLSGTIIGVGLFALPYITSKLGFWVILSYFLVLGSLVIFVHYILGELSLATPDKKRTKTALLKMLNLRMPRILRITPKDTMKAKI